MSSGSPEARGEKHASPYDADYYASHLGAVPYTWEHPVWREFFGTVADALVAHLEPATAFDAGCALGFLVAALRERGVEAYGIDISEFAISEVPKRWKQYCSVGSVSEPFPARYDVVTCIEVLEHLPADSAAAVVANLCAHSDRVLFSSTPLDELEPTHLNVGPPSYWAELFARQGFFRDFGFDAGVVAPHACLFERRLPDPIALAAGYEQRYVEARLRLADRDAALADKAPAKHPVGWRIRRALRRQLDSLQYRG